MKIEQYRAGSLTEALGLPQLHQGKMMFVGESKIGAVADEAEVLFVARWQNLMWTGMSQDATLSFAQLNTISVCEENVILASGWLLLERMVEDFPTLKNCSIIELNSYETAVMTISKRLIKFSIWEILTPVYSTILRPTIDYESIRN